MDFSHSHNAPGKEWIGEQLAAGLLKARKTNWNDVTLPGEVEAHALMLVGARAIGQDQARGLRPSRETINEWTSAMMLNTLTMTEAQEQDARAKAFYLIKKWTSLTYLEHAVQLYRDFLDAYAKQMDSPNPNQDELEKAYTYDFLGALVQMDQGIDTLRRGLDKRSAYGALIAGSAEVRDVLFGRTADEVGRKYDPFFLALGLKNNTYSDPEFATGLVHGVWIQQLMCYALDCSIAFGFEGLIAYETDTNSRDDGGRLLNGYEILAGPVLI